MTSHHHHRSRLSDEVLVSKYAVPFFPYDDASYVPSESCFEVLLRFFETTLRGNRRRDTERFLDATHRTAEEIYVRVGKQRHQTLDEVLAIVAYCTDVRHALGLPREANLWYHVNRSLRERAAELLQPYLPYYYYLTRGLEKVPLPKGPMVTWRGLDVRVTELSHCYTKGSVVCWVGFTSTTSSSLVTKRFTDDGRGGTLVKLLCKNAVPLHDYSSFAHEEEYLLPPNTMLEVTNVVASADARDFVDFPGVSLPLDVDLLVLREIDAPEEVKIMRFLYADGRCVTPPSSKSASPAAAAAIPLSITHSNRRFDELAPTATTATTTSNLHLVAEMNREQFIAFLHGYGIPKQVIEVIEEGEYSGASFVECPTFVDDVFDAETMREYRVKRPALIDLRRLHSLATTAAATAARAFPATENIDLSRRRLPLSSSPSECRSDVATLSTLEHIHNNHHDGHQDVCKSSSTQNHHLVDLYQSTRWRWRFWTFHDRVEAVCGHIRIEFRDQSNGWVNLSIRKPSTLTEEDQVVTLWSWNDVRVEVTADHHHCGVKKRSDAADFTEDENNVLVEGDGGVEGSSIIPPSRFHDWTFTPTMFGSELCFEVRNVHCESVNYLCESFYSHCHPHPHNLSQAVTTGGQQQQQHASERSPSSSSSSSSSRSSRSSSSSSSSS